MKRLLVVLAGVVAGAGLCALAFVLWLVLQPGPTDFVGGDRVPLSSYAGPSPTGVPASMAKADPVARGEYLARAADCEACHTAKGGRPFAGGFAFKLPFGTIYTPNITPDNETGIGTWTDAQFVAAVRHGIGKDGERLYPAFPYTSYAMLTDDDVLSIRTYLLSLKPVRQKNLPNTFRFPFNQRWLMTIWAAMFNRQGTFEPVADRSPEWNRGAYLVEAAAHCGECHTPRNLMQAMDTRRKFAGGVAEGWTAYNITGDDASGIGTWSVSELTEYLQSGHASGRGTAAGPMAQAVDLSLSKLTEDDVKAIATYLKTVPGIRTDDLSPPRSTLAAETSDASSDNILGRKIFQGNCVSCHAWTGEGAATERAMLIGSRAVNDPSGTNVARVIIEGTGNASGGRGMPAFGSAYTDDEIAAVANYVTSRFGNQASRLSPADIASLRSE